MAFETSSEFVLSGIQLDTFNCIHGFAQEVGIEEVFGGFAWKDVGKGSSGAVEERLEVIEMLSSQCLVFDIGTDGSGFSFCHSVVDWEHVLMGTKNVVAVVVEDLK